MIFGPRATVVALAGIDWQGLADAVEAAPAGEDRAEAVWWLREALLALWAAQSRLHATT